MQPTNETVEWDSTHAVALQIRHGQGDPTVTGIRRRPDSRTRWLPVVADYPDDYLPEFPELLGPGVYDMMPDGTALRKYFPQADFSVDQVRAILLDRVDDMQRAHLFETDVYVIRQIETGEEMPEDIKEARAEVRKMAKSLKRKIEEAKPTALAQVEVGLPRPHKPRRFQQAMPPFPLGTQHDGPGQPGDRPSALRVGEEPPEDVIEQ